MTQVCKRCGVEKALGDYGLQSSRNGRPRMPRGVCKVCDHARIAANRRTKRAIDPVWAQAQRDVGRDERRMARYGLALEDYQKMLEAQAGQCAGCGRHESEFARRLAIDHDHSTGAIRELLCSKCNTALGLVDDDVDRLIALAMYLIKHKETISV